MSCLHYNNNELFLDNIPLTQIANEFDTPCYVYSRQQIEKNWLAFDNAFKNMSHRICYAVKANSNLAILNILAKLGSGFDIVSGGELERVMKAQGDPQKIVFSGVGKSTREITQAINQNIFCIDIESASELDRIESIAHQLNKSVNIALRVNPDVNPNTHSHISTGLKENKFGIDLEEVMLLCKKINRSSHLKLIGIACHIGSQITELQPFIDALDCLLNIYRELKILNITVKHINIGGGLGIQYHQEKTLDVVTYANAIQSQLSGLPAELILEPGRAIVGNAGILLTRIEYLKHHHHKNFAIVDAGMNDLMRPALYDAYQPILPVIERAISRKIYDIAGPVCESADVLGKNRELAIEQNDLLAIDMAGAYGSSMNSTYNSRCLPAEVMIDENKIMLIRKRQTLSQLLENESHLK